MVKPPGTGEIQAGTAAIKKPQTILCHFTVCTVFVTWLDILKMFPYFCKDRQATALTGFSCNRASQ